MEGEAQGGSGDDGAVDHAVVLGGVAGVCEVVIVVVAGARWTRG